MDSEIKLAISNIQKHLKHNPKIVAMLVYGSAARNEVNNFSDVDLLIVTLSNDLEQIKMIKNKIFELWPASINNPVSPAVYYAFDLFSMAEANSLFFIHLQMEALILFDKKKIMTFLKKKKKPYKNFNRDINIYIQACEETSKSLEVSVDHQEILFELSILASITRNATISYCAHIGYPTFSRLRSYEKIAMTVSLKSKLTFKDYGRICMYRKAFDAGESYKKMPKQPIKIQKKILEFLIELKDISNAKL